MGGEGFGIKLGGEGLENFPKINSKGGGTTIQDPGAWAKIIMANQIERF